MAKSKKQRKKRAEKYDPKLKIEGSFEDVIKASVGKPPPPTEELEKEERPQKPPKK